MLSNLEIATIRAALRFWMDEMVPHGPMAAKSYLDGPGDGSLDSEGIRKLIDRFDPSAVRYIATDRQTGQIVSERLLTRGDLQDLPAGEPDSPVIHAVIATGE